jgi:hypothetical protein
MCLLASHEALLHIRNLFEGVLMVASANCILIYTFVYNENFSR